MDDENTQDFADGSDVGREVWALMPAESTPICTQCGAPCHLCQHTDSWQLFDIPSVAHGKLLSYAASVERAEPDCRIEGAGMDSPVRVFRTEDAANQYRRTSHAYEMNLMVSWATGKTFASV